MLPEAADDLDGAVAVAVDCAGRVEADEVGEEHVTGFVDCYGVALIGERGELELGGEAGNEVGFGD